jgi:protein-S-isoprenylcysteine O-methyltransferase Ste14
MPLSTIIAIVLLHLSRRGVHPVTGALVVFQMNAAWLLARRPRGSRIGFNRLDVTCTLPSLLISSLFISLAPKPATWPTLAQAAFVLGAAISVASLCQLGDAFGFLPTCRTLVVSGPYRLVRNPAYLGELMMSLSAAISLIAVGRPDARMRVLSLAAIVGLVAGVVWRIRIEERHLSRHEAWRVYTRSARHRLLPRVW